jgi:hypothetical protein
MRQRTRSGAKNDVLVKMWIDGLEPLKVKVRMMEELAEIEKWPYDRLAYRRAQHEEVRHLLGKLLAACLVDALIISVFSKSEDRGLRGHT